MGLSITQEVLSLALRDPFRIARSEHNEGARITTVIVELRHSDYPDLVGVGEGYPDRYYGETPETMAAVFPLLLAKLGRPGVFEPSEHGLIVAGAILQATIRGHGAAKCAVDIALHDLVGKILDLPVHVILDLPALAPPTDFTIGIDLPVHVILDLPALAPPTDFPTLKIKCGGAADLATLRAVRDVFAGPIRVDANTAWSRADAEALLPELVDLGVELIEQPFGAKAYRDLAWLQERSPLPIVADESCVFPDDLDALVGVVEGVNVKLAKCGGIGAAKAMLERARKLGFRTFIGCMEETSVGIAASAVVASLAEWVDLDGNLLLADDPFSGLELGPDKRWRLADRPGLGLTRTGT